MEKIFISYSREDQKQAQEIYDTLLNRPDVEPWLDLTRMKLVPWDPECRKQIEESSYVLALISKASLSSSGYVATEWAHAIKTKKRILPFLLDRSIETNPDAPEILDGFKEISWARAHDSFEDALRKVLREVYGDLARGTFRETFSSLGTDNEGWRLEGWTLDDADAGNENSQSITAVVAPSFFSQKQTHIASIPLALGSWSRIAYVRRLALHRANTTATANFQTTITDGSHVIAIEKIELSGTELGYDDGEWRLVKEELDLRRLSGRNVTLNFTLDASDMIAMPLTKGKANIDNIWID